QGWDLIKAEIDAGRPLIVGLSWMHTVADLSSIRATGHYVVIMNYDTDANGNRKVYIAHWGNYEWAEYDHNWTGIGGGFPPFKNMWQQAWYGQYPYVKFTKQSTLLRRYLGQLMASPKEVESRVLASAPVLLLDSLDMSQGLLGCVLLPGGQYVDIYPEGDNHEEPSPIPPGQADTIGPWEDDW